MENASADTSSADSANSQEIVSSSQPVIHAVMPRSSCASYNTVCGNTAYKGIRNGKNTTKKYYKKFF